MTPDRPIIIGGGIAGLVVAWELARAGRRPRLLESGQVVGGCLARHTVGGLDLDSGAESYATATPAVADLITDLGLASSLVTPNPVGAWVRHAGGSAPLPAAALLGIPAHPFAADVRRVLGLTGSLRACLDLVIPGSRGSSVTLGGLVASRMGRRVVQRLVEPVAGGVYSTDPDELEVDTIQPRLRTAMRQAGSLSGAVRALRGGGGRPGSAVGGLEGGMFVLVETLRSAIENLGGSIETGAEVTSLRRSGERWLITTDAGPLDASEVVLAVPGPSLSRLLRDAEVTVPPTSSATSNVELVTLVVDHPSLEDHPRGNGVLVSAKASGVTAKALTHATAKWAWLAEAAGAGRHVLRLSYGRGDQELPAPDDLTRLALADAGTLTGIVLTDSALVDSAVVRWTSALPRPQPGHRAAMDELRRDVCGRPGLHLAGSVIAGTGLAAVVADARQVGAEVVSPTRR